jgi:uncharacterized protein
VKVAGTYTFEAPRDIVFEMLQDPEVLAKIIPGCEQLNKTGENEYDAALNISVGPVKGQFKGGVSLADIVAPESYTMNVNGKGPAGFVNGVGKVRLEEQDGGTLMHYDGDATVGGRIVSVGQRLLDSVAKSMIKQSLEGVNTHIKARIEADRQPKAVAAPTTATSDKKKDQEHPQSQVQSPVHEDIEAKDAPEVSQTFAQPATAPKPKPASTPVAPPKQPSTAEFAANVAVDVAKDLGSSIKPQQIAIGVGVVAVVFLLLRRGRKKKS